MWPPEDHQGLARVRAATSIPIAAGENLASVQELATMLQAGAIDICQPSVIKFGGIEAVRQAVVLIRAHGIDYVPRCFYFGPGYLASLHLAAAYAPDVPFELFHGTLEASPYHDAVKARRRQGSGSGRAWLGGRAGHGRARTVSARTAGDHRSLSEALSARRPGFKACAPS